MRSVVPGLRIAEVAGSNDLTGSPCAIACSVNKPVARKIAKQNMILPIVIVAPSATSLHELQGSWHACPSKRHPSDELN
jgi:hypothetical protein